MRQGVFLDRDGVINVKPKPGEYIRSWEEFQLIPEVVDWIRLFNALGLPVIVVINQRGVARDHEAVGSGPDPRGNARGVRASRSTYRRHILLRA
jgi:hypothetical protein